MILVESIKIKISKKTYNFYKQKWYDGKEIDVLLPDLKLGFEFNGEYWHSPDKKKIGYHFSKSREALKNKNIILK